MSKYAVVLLIGFLIILPMAIGVASQSALFEQGNAYYADQQYSQAIDSYEALLQQNMESAALYYNLGNAHFKNGDLGLAVLNYLRAQRLEPGNEDIDHNLEFARQFSRVQMEGVTLNPINSTLAEIVASYRLEMMAWVTSGFFIAMILLLIARFGFGRRGSVVRVPTIILVILFVATAGLTTFKYRNDYLTRRAVIVTDECPVLSGPSVRAEIEFQGASGLILIILDESDEYYNVLFENQRRGWVRKDLVSEV